MKTKIQFAALALALLSTINSQLSTLHAQGALTPPSAPAPTMRSLDQIEPRTPLTALTAPGNGSAMFVITNAGSYFLTGNVAVPGALDGIRIAASDVVVDLKGFTLAGAANANAVAVRTITPNLGRIQIRNGQLTSWVLAVDFTLSGPATNALLEDLQMVLVTNVSNATAVSGGDGSRFVRCSISGANGVGATALFGGNRCTVEACTVFNCYSGFILGSDAVVKDCRLNKVAADNAISVLNSSIVRNNLVDGCKTGIRFGGGCIVSQNTCQNGSGSGFNFNGDSSRVEDNLSVSNAFYGFLNLGTTGNLVVRNFARANLSGNFNLSLTDSPGPIITSSGTITNTSPWANFSY